MLKRNRIITAALVPALTLGGVGIGTTAVTVLATAPAAAAAEIGPWSAPTALTLDHQLVNVADVQSTVHGDAVALWYWTPDDDHTVTEVWAAVRPARSAAWGTPQRLTAGAERTAQLGPSEDGSVTASWTEKPASGGTALRVSVLAPGATQWGAPVDIASASSIVDPKVAVSPNGRAAATWRQNASQSSEIYVAERTAVANPWSQPMRVAATEAGAYAAQPEIAVGRTGAIAVAWTENRADGRTAKSTVRNAGSAEWSAPAPIGDPALWTGSPKLAVGNDGMFVVAWQQSASESTDGTVLLSARRKADEAQPGWFLAEAVATNDNGFQTVDPLIGPNGDATLVWLEYTDRFDVRTSTRSAATDTWSEPKTLSTGYVPEQFDANIGYDGTVQAGWAQNSGADDQRVFVTAARVGGVWGTPRTLSEAPSDYAEGAVAVGPDGNASAVWAQGYQLWTAGTGLTAPQPAPKLVRRDHVGADGYVDLFSRTASGELVVHKGDASKAVSAKVSGGAWPAASTVIPFGDLTADGCNDVLVRNAAGELHRYSPECGSVVTPQTPSVKIGTGWGGFDTLVSSGDLTGDGLSDLVGRHASTGDLYLYAGVGTGFVKGQGKIGTGWKTVTPIGAGDLNADGRGDILGKDTSGRLWRYYGNGKGAIGSGTQIGSGWGGHNATVGIGDLTKDGVDDLVSRTTGGDLYRYEGNGTGAYRSGVKLGSGWGAYSSLS
ncbi:VCBS repeat-containing protein [Streptomyces sp. NPDC000410]|uniref:FG-GAP repeat domain-containing protein n=1 Tax=Streptomyces sp. NPDC000410 TaxID=3154254 RepID=UPI003319CFE3